MRNFMSVITDNLNVGSNEALITPGQLKSELPLKGAALKSVQLARNTIFSILDRTDPRLFVVVGPCSIHDTEAAIDYAKRLKVLADKVQDTLYIVMRVYFEKPRTAIGWKGLVTQRQKVTTRYC
jgi:3-deoxy-7-phosphoheptulonate synthase